MDKFQITTEDAVAIMYATATLRAGQIGGIPPSYASQHVQDIGVRIGEVLQGEVQKKIEKNLARCAASGCSSERTVWSVVVAGYALAANDIADELHKKFVSLSN